MPSTPSTRRHAKTSRRPLSLPALIARSPLKGVELDLERDRSPPRDRPLWGAAAGRGGT